MVTEKPWSVTCTSPDAEGRGLHNTPGLSTTDDIRLFFLYINNIISQTCTKMVCSHSIIIITYIFTLNIYYQTNKQTYVYLSSLVLVCYVSTLRLVLFHFSCWFRFVRFRFVRILFHTLQVRFQMSITMKND